MYNEEMTYAVIPDKYWDEGPPLLEACFRKARDICARASRLLTFLRVAYQKLQAELLCGSKNVENQLYFDNQNKLHNHNTTVSFMRIEREKNNDFKGEKK